jgi:hypothetical protein
MTQRETGAERANCTAAPAPLPSGTRTFHRLSQRTRHPIERSIGDHRAPTERRLSGTKHLECVGASSD